MAPVPGVVRGHAVTAGVFRIRRFRRAFFFLVLSTFIMHPNAGQLLFSLMVWMSFIAFIPFEEHQLLKARGQEYRDYMSRVPYRVFRGVW